MKNYQAQSFKDIGDSVLGQAIWEYLNSDDARVRLELATRLGHPAVEGIDDILLNLFDQEVKKDRVKQAIGHMVKQVLEESGYEIDKKSVKCGKSELFAYATRYKKLKSSSL